MARRWFRPILALLLAGSVGCTSRGTPVPTATPTATPLTRTYSANVKPVTSLVSCHSCHTRLALTDTGLGTYDYDFRKRQVNRSMVLGVAQSDLTAQQIKDVTDWVDSGAPDDDTPY